MVERIRNMIDLLRDHNIEQQIAFLVDYKFEWLGEIDEECVGLIDQRLNELTG